MTAFEPEPGTPGGYYKRICKDRITLTLRVITPEKDRSEYEKALDRIGASLRSTDVSAQTLTPRAVSLSEPKLCPHLHWTAAKRVTRAKDFDLIVEDAASAEKGTLRLEGKVYTADDATPDEKKDCEGQLREQLLEKQKFGIEAHIPVPNSQFFFSGIASQAISPGTAYVGISGGKIRVVTVSNDINLRGGAPEPSHDLKVFVSDVMEVKNLLSQLGPPSPNPTPRPVRGKKAPSPHGPSRPALRRRSTF